MRTLNTNEIQILAEGEQMMDDGIVPFVMFGGGRMMVRKEVMDHFKLKHGQTINEAIFIAIQEKNIELLTAEIAAMERPH